ncbi:MAG TPA: hypothetical protein QF549_01690 [Candidatus Saccharimonadaceae bacterium]|nr:hypothetical protein [Candidatus Saccharimonadaceae bacterium]
MDYTRTVLDYLRDFKMQTGRELEVMDPESPDGVMFCRAYDIMEFPTLVALSDDGHMQNQWRGLPLPTISEVSYYA